MSLLYQTSIISLKNIFKPEIGLNGTREKIAECTYTFESVQSGKTVVNYFWYSVWYDVICNPDEHTKKKRNSAWFFLCVVLFDVFIILVLVDPKIIQLKK